MYQSLKNLGSTDIKRLVLVVDDEEINREMLGMILSDEYNIMYAKDGEEALELIKRHSRLLSLILLDLLMPKKNGTELLTELKADRELCRIPVIVLTSERSAEVQSLRLGAADFIPKPYDMPDVIKARVQRTIELNEDRLLIETTETDELTGLYSKKFFYRYADQFDQYHEDAPMDAVYIKIDRFDSLTELYGRNFGDQVLKLIAGVIKKSFEENGGLACHYESDKFLMYCPRGTDYTALVSGILDSVRDMYSARIQLSVGVYPDADKSIDVEKRFFRAKLASENNKGGFGDTYGLYDKQMHEKALFEEKLVDEIDRAISEKQFTVFYQPKYNIQADKPYLASAEALVRWIHPEYGMISPGVFIPLFERCGLIQKVDRYVWNEAARQISEWKEKFGVTVPVSVNVSRIDMFDPDLTQILLDIVRDHSISQKDLLLEITESAYTDDSDQIIGVVHKFREHGFSVEMDDFGSGYSSLNMISALPIDALKLDMKFIRNMTESEKNIKMLELMIGIAKYLKVPVIAEGVETEEQLGILKDLGCDIVQGYYFSKPVPPKDFEAMIERKLTLC